jgi:hypothetical protein
METSEALSRPYTYDHIPELVELLPNTGGQPGLTYAQVCTHNARKAQDNGWKKVRGAKVYSIVTNKGIADMELLCKGEQAKGLDTKSGKRECLIDWAVQDLTGLCPNPKEAAKRNEPPKEK